MLIVTFAAALISGQVTRHHYQGVITALERDHQTTLDALRRQAQQQQKAALTQTRTLQQRLAQLDTDFTERLHADKRENRALRDALSAGTHELHLARTDLAACTLSAGGDTAAGRVGDAAEIRFSGEAGRAVQSVREGIIADRAKLDYLQHYITTVLSAGQVSHPLQEQ